jgi:hypothetical protein
MSAWVCLGPITRGKFVGEIPLNKPRVVRDDCVPWQIGLGMHNFRAAIRNKGSLRKSCSRKRSVKGVKNEGCVSSNSYRHKRSRRFHLRSRAKYDKRRVFRIMGRWDRNVFKNERKHINVNKSIEARGLFSDEFKALRLCLFRRDGRYWRRLTSLSKISGKSMVNNGKNLSERILKRRKWLFDHSWSKLPRSYLENTKDNFEAYRRRCDLLGHFTVFHLITHLIDPESKRVAALFKSMVVSYDFFGLTKSIQEDGFCPPMPERKNFRNFKTFNLAVDVYKQVISMVCLGKIPRVTGDVMSACKAMKARIDKL